MRAKREERKKPVQRRGNDEKSDGRLERLTGWLAGIGGGSSGDSSSEGKRRGERG